MATDSDRLSGPLSDFGETRLEGFARERAERIDAQMSTWRYYGSLAFGLLSVGAWLAAFVSLIVVLGDPFLGIPLVEGLQHFALNVGVGAVAGILSNRLSNPDVEDLI